MIPFAGNNAQNLLHMIENGTVKSVNGMLMVANDIIISEVLIEKPLIITQIDTFDNRTLFYYGYNINSSIHATLTHTFIERCYLINAHYVISFILSGLWFLFTIFWLVYVFKKNTSLEKVLIFVPALQVPE